jgi:hypothetical protein
LFKWLPRRVPDVERLPMAPSSLKHVVNALLKGRRKHEEQTFGEEKSDMIDLDEDDLPEEEYREGLS